MGWSRSRMGLAQGLSFICRHPKTVVFGWIAVAVIVVLIAPDLGRVAAESEGNLLPADTESVRAMTAARRLWPLLVPESRLVLMVQRSDGLQTRDHAYLDAIAERVRNATDRPEVIISVLTPRSSEQHQEMLNSKDGKSSMLVIGLKTNWVVPITRGSVNWLRALVAKIPDAPEGLELWWSGDSVLGDEYMRAIQTTLDRAAVVTVVLLMIVLLFVYRSLSLALIPLASIGISLLIARGLVGTIGSLGYQVSMLVELFLVVVLFGSGTDLCLFLSWRFGEQWREGEPDKAMRIALKRSAHAVCSSAGTAIIALCLMFFTDFKLFSHTGPSVALGLLVCLAASLTLTPALLILLAQTRPQAFAGFRKPGGTFWNRIGHGVMKRPALCWSLTLLLMAPMAVIGGMYTVVTSDILAEMPPNTPVVNAIERINTAYGPGTTAPLTLLLRAPHDLRDSNGLSLIDEISHIIDRRKHIGMVLSATQPLGLDGTLGNGRLKNRLGEIQKGMNDLYQGSRELGRSLNKISTAVRTNVVSNSAGATTAAPTAPAPAPTPTPAPNPAPAPNPVPPPSSSDPQPGPTSTPSTSPSPVSPPVVAPGPLAANTTPTKPAQVSSSTEPDADFPRMQTAAEEVVTFLDEPIAYFLRGLSKPPTLPKLDLKLDPRTLKPAGNPLSPSSPSTGVVQPPITPKPYATQPSPGFTPPTPGGAPSSPGTPQPLPFGENTRTSSAVKSPTDALVMRSSQETAKAAATPPATPPVRRSPPAANAETLKAVEVAPPAASPGAQLARRDPPEAKTDAPKPAATATTTATATTNATATPARGQDNSKTLLENLTKAARGAYELANGAHRVDEELTKIVSDPATRRVLERLLIRPENIQEFPEIQKSFEAYISERGDVSRFEILQRSRTFSPEALEQVQALRRDLNAYLRETEGVNHEILIAGPNADSEDVRSLTRADLDLTWIVVPLGVLLVLYLALRDVGVCLNLVATMILTYWFAMGVTHVVFVGLLGSAGIDWKVAYFLFVLLVAIGVDYNIFLMTRLREEARASSLRAGIPQAIGATGGLISSAAAITVASFASFLFSPLESIRQLGFALVVGISIDAVLVRPILMPCGHWLLCRYRFLMRDTSGYGALSSDPLFLSIPSASATLALPKDRTSPGASLPPHVFAGLAAASRTFTHPLTLIGAAAQNRTTTDATPKTANDAGIVTDTNATTVLGTNQGAADAPLSEATRTHFIGLGPADGRVGGKLGNSPIHSNATNHSTASDASASASASLPLVRSGAVLANEQLPVEE